MTSHRTLFFDGDIKGLNVLIHGGVGVVGEAAILLAKWAGAYVIATIRKENDRELAKKAGSDMVINMKEEDAVKIIKEKTDSKGADRIIGVNIKANFKLDLDRLLKVDILLLMLWEKLMMKLLYQFLLQ